MSQPTTPDVGRRRRTGGGLPVHRFAHPARPAYRLTRRSRPGRKGSPGAEFRGLAACLEPGHRQDRCRGGAGAHAGLVVHGVGAVATGAAAAGGRHGDDRLCIPRSGRADGVLRALSRPGATRTRSGVLLRPHRGGDRAAGRSRPCRSYTQPARRRPPERLRRRRVRSLQGHPPSDQPRTPPDRLRPNGGGHRLRLQHPRAAAWLPAGAHRGGHHPGRRPGGHHPAPGAGAAPWRRSETR